MTPDQKKKWTAAFQHGASADYTAAEMAHDLNVLGAAQRQMPPMLDVEQQVLEFEEYPTETQHLGEIRHTPMRDDKVYELQESPIEEAIIIEDERD